MLSPGRGRSKAATGADIFAADYRRSYILHSAFEAIEPPHWVRSAESENHRDLKRKRASEQVKLFIFLGFAISIPDKDSPTTKLNRYKTLSLTSKIYLYIYIYILYKIVLLILYLSLILLFPEGRRGSRKKKMKKFWV